LRPRLHVMDGIVAMEGNGPRSGDARPMKVLILSADPVAVDATFCRLVAMEPTYIPTIRAGYEVGLGRFDAAEIAYVGDDLESMIDPSFRLVRKPVYANASYAHYRWLKSALLPKPAIDASRCVRCGMCVEACPVPGKALRFENGRRAPPVYDHARCIRCYCCQEMCPHQAIGTRTPLLGRLLGMAG
jgi:ferredoxin